MIFTCFKRAIFQVYSITKQKMILLFLHYHTVVGLKYLDKFVIKYIDKSYFAI